MSLASEEGRKLDRREFTMEAALAMLSGVAITISACGGSSSSPSSPTAQASPTPLPAPTPSPEATPSPAPSPTATPGSVTDKDGSISANHGHAARVTAAQQLAGGALLLDITGSASHPHTVQLSAGSIRDIAEGKRVSEDSSTNSGHSHTVTFN
jgi:hypothetical protein